MIDMEIPKLIFSGSRGAPIKLFLNCRGLLEEVDEFLIGKTSLVGKFNRN